MKRYTEIDHVINNTNQQKIILPNIQGTTFKNFNTTNTKTTKNSRNNIQGQDFKNTEMSHQEAFTLDQTIGSLLETSSGEIYTKQQGVCEVNCRSNYLSCVTIRFNCHI